jgi:branched-chain amino acid transport system substrate-binding protein
MRNMLVAAFAASLAVAASAQEPLKIGLVAPYSGPQAEYGKQMEGGMKAWLKIHGDTVAGRKVLIIPRDNAGPNPESAKRLSQELVTRDKVDFLAGYGFTPDAIAAAPVATQAKVPLVVMNAASSVVTTKSPYIVRFSMTLPQVSAPMAQWAAKNGIRKVYILVSDYAPGIDSENAFRAAFTAAGGKVVDAVHVPLRNPEFAPYVQRIKDAKPGRSSCSCPRASRASPS